MGKKLLVIFGAVAVTGYLFRDRLLAGAVSLVERANALFREDLGWTEDDEAPDFSSDKER